MRTFNCVDCQEDTECEWCEVCTRPVCADCDMAHDCLAEHLEPEAEDVDDEEV